MWNIPRVLPASIVASFLLASALLLLGRTSALVAVPQPAPPVVKVLPVVRAAAAATCGDVVINEVLYKQTDPLNDEWVELYTVTDLLTDTVLTVTDLESSGPFTYTWTLTETLPAGRFVVIHGNDQADAESPAAGHVNLFGAGRRKLSNTADQVVLRLNGVDCEELFWGSSTSLPESTAPITYYYGTGSNISAGETIQRNPSGTGSEFLQGEDSVFFAPSTIGRNNNDGTVPVTLAWFLATPAENDTVRFDWQTATESANAGFHLLAATPAGLTPLNPELIPSSVIDSVEPTAYTYSTVTAATEFYLQEVALDGTAENHGPFRLGEPTGVPMEMDAHTDRATGGDEARRIYLPFVIE